MKKILILSILFISFCGTIFSQTNCKLIGEITQANNNYYLLNAGKLKFIELKDNKFQIEIKKGQYPEGIAITTISKSKINYLTPTIWIDTDSVNIRFDFQNEKEVYSIDHKYIYQDISEEIEKANKTKQVDLIRENINTYPALFFLYKKMEGYSIKDIEQLYSITTKESKSSIIVQRIKSYITAKTLPSPKKGVKFSPFELEGKSGKTVQIKQINEKYRLLAFVSIGCHYSLASLSELSKMHKTYGKYIDFITIWNDEIRDTWQNEKAELKSVIEWTDLWDKTKFANYYFDTYILPVFYLIDKNGFIIKIIKGFNQKKIEKILKQIYDEEI